MKSVPECIPCLFRQACNTARLATDDPVLQMRILRTVAHRLTTLQPETMTPAALSQPAYEITAELTGQPDPYREQKRETNRVAMGMLARLREQVFSAPDPLASALHVAVAGNIIDLGIGHEFDIERDVTAMLGQPFTVDATESFRDDCTPGRKLLYLGDNAGEIVFDRLLVEVLLAQGVRVTFAVKSAPIINDATREDAEEAGLTGLTPVIETGAGDIGVNFERVSPGFRAAFREADVILSKGQGNFETCADCDGNLYFLLKAKCHAVARELGVRLGDLVFGQPGSRSSRDA